jgi:hypothetical protein
MKNVIISICTIFLLQAVAIAQSSWISPEYKQQAYRKVMVRAKFSDELQKRKIEDATVKLLQDNGIAAIPSYSNLTDQDLLSLENFMAKADALEIDALVVYAITGENTEYKSTPNLNMNVGIPVHLGIFRGALGTNLPIAGGTKTIKIITANANFFNRSSKDLQWSFPLKVKVKGDMDHLAASFAKTTINAMLKDQLFVQGSK